MFAARHADWEYHLAKSVIIALVVCFLVLVVTRVAAGDDSRRWALPTDVTPHVGRVEKTITEDADPSPQLPTARRLWTILELHRSHQFASAITQWERLTLPTQAEPWRAAAVGLAHFRRGDVAHAQILLTEAKSLEPANAIVHYLAGIVGLMAESAEMPMGPPSLVPDMNTGILSVMNDPPAIVSLAAYIDLHRAIELAAGLDLNERLVVPQTMFVSIGQYDTVHPNQLLPAPTPRVRDLLRALELEDFVGKAHLALARLDIQGGSLHEAESHLDEAAKQALSVGDDYEALGEAFAEVGDHADATRVFMKATRGTNKIAGPTSKALLNLRRALDRPSAQRDVH